MGELRGKNQRSEKRVEEERRLDSLVQRCFSQASRRVQNHQGTSAPEYSHSQSLSLSTSSIAAFNQSKQREQRLRRRREREGEKERERERDERTSGDSTTAAACRRRLCLSPSLSLPSSASPLPLIHPSRMNPFVSRRWIASASARERRIAKGGCWLLRVEETSDRSRRRNYFALFPFDRRVCSSLFDPSDPSEHKPVVLVSGIEQDRKLKGTREPEK